MRSVGSLNNADGRANSPLVTILLLSYNQEKFIAEAVRSVLAQDYANLEVIISDDCSLDSTYQIIKDVVNEYSGEKSISIIRNEKNLGLTAHFNALLSRARGEIIVIAAGDDVSLPHRVSQTVAILQDDSCALFVSFTDIIVDENGKQIAQPSKRKAPLLRKVTLSDFLAGEAPSMSGASRGFRRGLFDGFGALNEKCPTEDTPYILRGLMMGCGLVCGEAGILYRQHGESLSAPASIHLLKFEQIKAQYLQDLERGLAQKLISEDMAIRIRAWAERNYRRRMVYSKLHKSRAKLTEIVGNMLFSQDFSLREKMGMLRRGLMRTEFDG